MLGAPSARPDPSPRRRARAGALARRPRRCASPASLRAATKMPSGRRRRAPAPPASARPSPPGLPPARRAARGGAAAPAAARPRARSGASSLLDAAAQLLDVAGLRRQPEQRLIGALARLAADGRRLRQPRSRPLVVVGLLPQLARAGQRLGGAAWCAPPAALPPATSRNACGGVAGVAREIGVDAHHLGERRLRQIAAGLGQLGGLLVVAERVVLLQQLVLQQASQLDVQRHALGVRRRRQLAVDQLGRQRPLAARDSASARRPVRRASRSVGSQATASL